MPVPEAEKTEHDYASLDGPALRMHLGNKHGWPSDMSVDEAVLIQKHANSHGQPLPKRMK